MLSLLYLGVNAQQCFFCSSCRVLRQENLKSWLNSGLQLTIFRGTGPGSDKFHSALDFLLQISVMTSAMTV